MTRKPEGLLVVALLERGAENVAQRRPRIGGAVLRDGLLLFGDFQCLDRDLHLAGLLVELDHPRIDLFADGETLGALIGALTRQNVSLRRILRRSTITSESSDIENSPFGGLETGRTHFCAQP